MTIVPEHPAARDARSKAWRQIGALSPTASPLPARPAPWANQTIGPDRPNPLGEPEPAIRFLDNPPGLNRGRSTNPSELAARFRDQIDARNARRTDQTIPFDVASSEGSLRNQDRRCPRCGNAMQIREGNRGAFLSCLNYPKCRGVAPIQSRPRTTASSLASAQTFRIEAEPSSDRPSTQNGRFLLWADAIGGYLVCPSDRVVIGRAGGGSRADIPLMGDLAPEHAVIIRDEDGYLITSRHRTLVNGKRVEASPLRDGDVIRLGSTVELEFRQPSPVSATARLAILSRHRLPLTVDGVILLSDTCVIGPPGRSHVPAANIAEPIVLYRQGSDLWCRAGGGFEVDGKPQTGRARLGPRSVVHGEGFSFSVEPLDPSHTETV